MIQISMLGRLGRDAEVKTFDNGKQVINFSLAHTKNVKDASGNWTKETVWVECQKWVNEGQTANVSQYMKKGGMVYVQGEPTVRAYVPTGETVARATQVINCFVVELAGNAAGDGNTQQQPGSTATYQPQQAPQQQTQQFAPQQPNTQQGGAFPPDDLPF